MSSQPIRQQSASPSQAGQGSHAGQTDSHLCRAAICWLVTLSGICDFCAFFPTRLNLNFQNLRHSNSTQPPALSLTQCRSVSVTFSCWLPFLSFRVTLSFLVAPAQQQHNQFQLSTISLTLRASRGLKSKPMREESVKSMTQKSRVPD